MIIQNNKFLIYGTGKTGKSLEKFIIANGGRIAMLDKKTAVEMRKPQNKKALFDDIYAMILSPGVPISDEIVKLAIAKKIPVLSEMDFAFSHLAGVKVGITGSGGKSTTTKLIYEILKEEFPDVRIGGNYGTPVCDMCESSTSKTISVIEVSSFMLEQSKTFAFDVAVFMNISKNHLDRHKTMQNYIKSKCKISKNALAPSVVVLPCGEQKIKELLMKNAKKNHPPKIVEFQSVMNAKPYQTNQSPQNKISADYIFVDGKEIVRSDEFSLQGTHNKENLLIACTVAKLFKVSDKSIQKVSKNFQPLPHRFEKIPTKNGITYINDSKSTSGKSAEVSLSLVDFPAVLMVGGSDKKDDFTELFQKIKSNTFVVKTVLYGAVANKLETYAKSVGYFNIQKTTNFKTAFDLANSLCTPPMSLILMPACPSYDEFDNFEKRGEEFKRLVGELS